MNVIYTPKFTIDCAGLTSPLAIPPADGGNYATINDNGLAAMRPPPASPAASSCRPQQKR